ncbi:hypothetical protein KI811_16735 [Geobacter hydrogenophilus]|uniref:hypothetical protein n=1 Tax=Geobacter hydrogenophilus TaxID=40983 RepID=UPI001BD9C7A7|nr:hypothetical protein [Geobacter hydrogenophilus]MBT0895453.1 hypothetical protein [Geobacter hydrogenophilus]
MAAFTAFVLLATIAQAQNSVPEFRNYPVAGKFTGKNAPLQLGRKDRMFRTRLKEAARQKPNFAGHYILTTWGCGMECLMGAVIDARTGKVYRIPFTLCCWGDEGSETFVPVEFRLDSKLIIFSGVRDEKQGAEGKHFYTFENNRFVPISSVSKALP